MEYIRKCPKCSYTHKYRSSCPNDICRYKLTEKKEYKYKTLIEGFESEYPHSFANSDLPSSFFKLNIDESAFLIAKCLFYNNKVDTKAKEESLFENDEVLKIKLRTSIEKYVRLLSESIDNNELKYSHIQRDEKGNIINKTTYIDANIMNVFLAGRSIELGYYFDFEYSGFENYLHSVAIKKVVSERAKKKLGEAFENLGNDKMIILLSKKNEEIEDLKTKLQHQEDEHFNTSERNSLLKLVIGMAKGKYKYDPEATRNNNLQHITNALSLAGVPLDGDTIRKYLKEASKVPTDKE